MHTQSTLTASADSELETLRTRLAQAEAMLAQWDQFERSLRGGEHGRPFEVPPPVTRGSLLRLRSKLQDLISLTERQ